MKLLEQDEKMMLESLDWRSDRGNIGNQAGPALTEALRTLEQ